MLYRHLAASEGCYKVTEWLIELGSDVNALDRFKRTPLEVSRLPFRPFLAESCLLLGRLWIAWPKLAAYQYVHHL